MEATNPKPVQARIVLAVALLLHLLPFAVRPALIGGDEPHYALMAWSLATDGDFALADAYAEVEEGSKGAGRKRAGQALDRHLRELGDSEGGHREVFSHPVGLPILAAPLLFVQQRLAPGAAPDLPLGLLTLSVTFAGLLAGRRLLRRLVPEPEADLLAFGLYFTTPLWYYSRTFFTEPYVWAFAVLGAAALAERRFGRAGLWLGLALWVKEPALLVVAPILGFALARFGLRPALRAAVGPAVATGLFSAKNLALYGRLWVPFQPYQVGDIAEGAWRVLLDPRHGLFLFAPLLLAALPGWLAPARVEPWWQRPAIWALAIVGGLYALTAAWIDWAGGTCYGPRLLLPAIPAFAPALLRTWQLARDRPWPRRLLGLLALAGFALQFCAGTEPVAAFWSASLGELLADPARTVAGLALGAGLLFALDKRCASPLRS